MKVLFTTQPYTGHWHPLVPLAKALREAGHEVAFSTSPDFCSTIVANGFRCFPVGRSETDEAREARLERMAPIPGPERAATMWSEYFVGIWAEQRLPDLMDVARRWKPDLFVREHAEVTACVVAESLGIPHAAVQVAAFRPYLHDLIAPNIDRLRASVDLPPDSDREMLHRYLLLCPLPPSLQDPANHLPITAHAIRHEGFDTSSGERLPYWVGKLSRAVPTVYATLGTVVNSQTAVLEAILEGLRDEPLNLVMTTGRDVDPSMFGPQHTEKDGKQIHVEQYIPQSLLLPHCSLVVTHGGSGTVRDSLTYGLPMVVIPVSGDQHINAARCAEIGVARVIAPDKRTPENIRNAVREVLRNPSYRRSAQRVKAEIEALPGHTYAVELLEHLAETHAPIPSQPPAY